MCCGTNIFINSPRTGGCCGIPMMNYVGFNSFSPGCFGYGFGCNSPANYALMGAGIGLGMAAGMAMPSIIKGIGSAGAWVWNNALVPAGKFIGKAGAWVWNNALVPAGKFIGKAGAWVFDNAIKPAWNGIKSAFNWVGNGVKNLWNKIFKKRG